MSCRGAIRQAPTMRPVWWRLLLFNLTQVLVFVYASWFWIAGLSSEHFQQDSGCETTVFLFARVSASASRGVSIFFAIFSVLFAVNWSVECALCYEDIFAFIKGHTAPLSPAVKLELLEHINTHCRDSLILLIDDPGLSSRSPSARLENMNYAYLVIKSEARETRTIVRLDRPLTDMNSKKKVQERIETMATFKRGLNSDDEEEVASIKFTELVYKTSRNPLDRFLFGFDEKRYNKIRLIWIAIAIACAIYTLLAIELMISWNSISGVYSIQPTGQLIPFLIGVIGLIKTLHDVNFKFAASLPQPNSLVSINKFS